MPAKGKGTPGGGINLSPLSGSIKGKVYTGRLGRPRSWVGKASGGKVLS